MVKAERDLRPREFDDFDIAVNGGRDGARTRDLRRDRPAL